MGSDFRCRFFMERIWFIVFVYLDFLEELSGDNWVVGIWVKSKEKEGWYVYGFWNFIILMMLNLFYKMEFIGWIINVL